MLTRTLGRTGLVVSPVGLGLAALGRPGYINLGHADDLGHDYGVAAIRYQNGGLGTVTASQISHGRENDLWIEIDGTRGSLEWHQEEPNKMWVRVNGKPQQLYTRAGGGLGATAAAATRIPSGHPEGYLEAFANVYTAAFEDMARRASGQKFDGANSLYPNVADGVDGMNFITQCVASSAENGAWRSLKHPLCR